jgi:hypothetical protein
MVADAEPEVPEVEAGLVPELEPELDGVEHAATMRLNDKPMASATALRRRRVCDVTAPFITVTYPFPPIWRRRLASEVLRMELSSASATPTTHGGS